MAVELAFNRANHVGTLAAGIIVVSSVFLGDLADGDSLSVAWLLFLSWIVLFVSVFFGVLSTGALVAHLESSRQLTTHRPVLRGRSSSCSSSRARSYS
jgi:hypothetical protein